ncbi:MAG: hypothetical protein NC453_25555 [Muribaculum sp.]|nr:hypothetical protein [Muribaculum sp.]
MKNYYTNDNPPFQLYQSENRLWGLKDCKGTKLPAVFHREGDNFWKEPNEILYFDPDEGFELLSWFDPDEWG